MSDPHTGVSTGSLHAFVGTMLHAAAAGEPLPISDIHELSTEKLFWLLAHLLEGHGLSEELPGRIVAALRDRWGAEAGRARMQP